MPGQLTRLILSFVVVALVAFAVAGAVNALMLAIFISAAISTGVIHRLFPGKTDFSLSLANLVAVYASIFAFFVDEAFGRIDHASLGAGFAVPLAFFVGGCWWHRADIRKVVGNPEARKERGFFAVLSWLVPVLLVGVTVLVLNGVAETVINTDLAFGAAMVLIGIILLAVSRDVAMFLVESGLLFEEFFARVVKQVIPAFAFLTFYSLIAIVFASLYSILSQHSSVTHFRVGGSARALSFPEAMHFSITTLSTVGYGDIIPASNLVRVVASLEVVSGVLLLLFGVSELLEYTREHRNKRRPNEPGTL